MKSRRIFPRWEELIMWRCQSLLNEYKNITQPQSASKKLILKSRGKNTKRINNNEVHTIILKETKSYCSKIIWAWKLNRQADQWNPMGLWTHTTSPHIEAWYLLGMVFSNLCDVWTIKYSKAKHKIGFPPHTRHKR